MAQLLPQLLLPAYTAPANPAGSEAAVSAVPTAEDHAAKAAFRAKVSEALVSHGSKYLKKGVIPNKVFLILMSRLSDYVPDCYVSG
jgi:hypothetical protein